MVFNSFEFAIFLPVAFLLYWFVFNKTFKTQNLLLLIASAFFYLFAEWKFTFILAFSGFVNFYLAKLISKRKDSKLSGQLFYLGIVLNVGILLYFKYFNFFIQPFINIFYYDSGGGFTPFHILLPLGISFFTFQMIGYLIDVYNEEIRPTDDILSFFTYLAYFPKILSGPIEKVQNFLPQIQVKRTFNYTLSVDGSRQILWGLFKKIVIANNFTILANTVFSDYTNLHGSTLLLGTIIYTISIYADFSGFSDMACGISKLFNIRITNNFNFPFFSTNVSDFWKKWHISLTSWMMNYVYTPLTFITRKHGKLGLIISIIFTFLLVGLWHGPNLTFIIFGLLHGLYFIPIIVKGSLNKKNISRVGKFFPSFNQFLKMCGVFLLISVTSVFFRADGLSQAAGYLEILFSKAFFNLPNDLNFQGISPSTFTLLIITACFFLFEWVGRDKEFPLQIFDAFKSQSLKVMLYWLLIIIIILYSGEEQKFIYFQF